MSTIMNKNENISGTMQRAHRQYSRSAGESFTTEKKFCLQLLSIHYTNVKYVWLYAP